MHVWGDGVVDKVFRTHDEQLSILQQRGMIISTPNVARAILEQENYYRLVNGYKDLFLQAGFLDRYKSGTTFEELVALYEFDFRLRHALLRQILRAEVHLKSRIAYRFSERYGHKNYLDAANFETSSSSVRIRQIQAIVQVLQEEINQQHAMKQGPVAHYQTTKGYVPLWVLIDRLTLGTASRFYAAMKTRDRQAVAAQYRISEDALRNVLSLLSLARNRCAHNERIYDFTSPKIVLKDHRVHELLGIRRNANGYAYAKRDLLAIVIGLRLLLEENAFQQLASDLQQACNALSSALQVITLTDVLAAMGFVPNWQDLRSIKPK